MQHFQQFKYIQPFTLIYLLHDDKALLIKRKNDKLLLPGKIIGLGGKVESTEDLFTSAIREFQEESGLTIPCPELKGNFTWMNEKGEIGITHLMVVREHSGTLKTSHREGELGWYDVADLPTLPDFAEYQRSFVPKIFSSSPFFYTGLSFSVKGRRQTYIDNLD
ncbi:MAG: NUDIX domain-containing protein [Pseudomonadales bacterium]|nr:NUDIX domain-containing protein [Candidatus Woesebacteria bacterium]MCB9801489.1 NUDIX domain-containing protein [Pseudomonadales bacterium]